MKPWLSVALVLVAGVGSLAAQKVSVGLAGGVLMPTGNYANADNIGFIGDLGVTVPISSAAIRLKGDYGETSHKYVEGNTQIIGGNADLMYSFAGTTVKPYIFGGVGYYSVKVDIPGFSGSESDVGFNAGVGLNLGQGFVEARYTSISTSGSSLTFFPIVVGVTF